MNTILGQVSRIPTEKNDLTASTGNRKVSQDNDNTTSENSPKNFKIKNKNLMKNKKEFAELDKNFDKVADHGAFESSVDKMPSKITDQKNQDFSLKESESDVYKIRMRIPSGSPSPGLEFLKKKSITDENHLDLSNTPIPFQGSEGKRGYGSDHFKALSFNRLVYDDSLPDYGNANENVIRSFELDNKFHTPYEYEENEEDLVVDTPHLGEEHDVENEDPIQEFFSPSKYHISLLEQEPKESITKHSKIHTVTSGIDKSKEKPLLGGKKRGTRISRSSIEKKSQKAKEPSHSPIVIQSTKNIITNPMKKRLLKRTEKENEGINGPDDKITQNQENIGNRKSLRLKKKDTTMEESKGCTCKKSQCIKLYGECFIAKGFGSPSCGCEDGFNMEENEEEIIKIRNKISSRNPHAFHTKLKVTDKGTAEQLEISSEGDDNSVVQQHVKGGNGKKSQCSNNYCECHQLGAKCTELCSCSECKN